MRHRLHIAMLFCAVLAATGTVCADRVELIDARTLTGRVVSLDAKDLVIELDGQKKSYLRDDVLAVVLSKPADLLNKAGQKVLLGRRNTRLAVSEVLGLSDEVFTLSTPLLGKVRAPMESVEDLLLTPANLAPEQLLRRCREQRLTPAERDMLVVSQEEGPWLSIEGVAQAIDRKSGKLTFKWNQADRKVDLGKIVVLRLARVDSPKGERIGTLVGSRGCRVGFTSLTMDKNTVRLRSAAWGEHELPRTSVASLQFETDKIARLTDLTPTKVREHGFFDAAFGRRVGKSVGGSPLKLGGKVYRDGLGLHSFASLTYDLGGDYRRFVCLAGIDDAVRPAGAASLQFFGDGNPLAKPTVLTGESDPEVIRLDIKGVETLRIEVGFGPDKLGVADHVNLVNPRLLR